MKTLVALLCLAAGLLYLGQIITVANFALAQRLGLQERADQADPLLSQLELWAARWDLCWLWTLPVAGILLLIDHPWWPFAALVGSGAFVDTGGREAAKIIALRQQGVRTGSPGQQRLAMAVYIYFIALGLLAIASGLGEVI